MLFSELWLWEGDTSKVATEGMADMCTLDLAAHSSRHDWFLYPLLPWCTVYTHLRNPAQMFTSYVACTFAPR